jgi:hypothetical protein
MHLTRMHFTAGYLIGMYLTRMHLTGTYTPFRRVSHRRTSLTSYRRASQRRASLTGCDPLTSVSRRGVL